MCPKSKTLRNPIGRLEVAKHAQYDQAREVPGAQAALTVATLWPGTKAQTPLTSHVGPSALEP